MTPTAGFYAMPRIPLPPGRTDEDYVLGLLRATGVLTVYGSGFGLPAAEALACGVPVLVSRVGGLPEVAGDLGIYVDPKNPESIAEGIERMLTDEAHRRRVAEEGPRRAAAFSYQAMARGYVAVYEAVAR